MALKPIYIPIEEYPFVDTVFCNFKWSSGFNPPSLKKNIISLHEVAKQKGIDSVLEVSGASDTKLGKKLSAFHLVLTAPNNKRMSVEAAYQGSKIFEQGGPFQHLYSVSSHQAKVYDKLKRSGKLIGFKFLNEHFPTYPKTAFYSWLYINAMMQNEYTAKDFEPFQGFSDIFFNAENQANCQAYSLSLFISLSKRNLLDKALQDKNEFIDIITSKS